MSAALTARVLEVAAGEVGVKEVGINRGERVELYQATVGIPPGSSWCAAFVFFCFEQAARDLGLVNPLPKTGGVHKMFRRSPEPYRIFHPLPGAVYFHDSGCGLGHAGIVESVAGDHIVGIEGNTNEAGDREGDGVARKVRRFAYINLGMIDFAKPIPDVAA